MLKRDSLTAQMQQLSQVLAKVKRLIIEDDEDEAQRISSRVFQEYFSLTDDDLLHGSEDTFLSLIRSRQFQAEEVNMLAYFIDEYAGLQEEFSNQVILYKKLIRIFDYLEKELQFISFEHISRKNLLESQLQKFG